MSLADTIIAGVKAGDVDAIDLATSIIGRVKVVECSDAEIDAIAAFLHKPKPLAHGSPHDRQDKLETADMRVNLTMHDLLDLTRGLMRDHINDGPRYHDPLVDLCLEAAGWDGDQWDKMSRIIGVKV